MDTVLYRISSGEVVKITSKEQTFSDRDQTYWGVLTDPPFPDGVEVRPRTPEGRSGNLRVLGFAKIWDNIDVRNATEAEIDNFAVEENEDEISQDAQAADDLMTLHPRFRRAFTALLRAASPPGRTKANLRANMRSALRRDD